MLRYLPIFLLFGFFAEIASIIWIGGILGVIPTLLLLIASGAVGVSRFRSAGVNVASALRSPIRGSALQEGLASATVLRIASGILFLIPGFFSDILGLLLLLTPVQRWLRSRLRVVSLSTARPRRQETQRFDRIIEVEAVEVDGEVEGHHHSKDYP